MRRLVAASAGVIVAGVPGGVAAVMTMAVIARRKPRPPRVDTAAVAARLLVMVGTGMGVIPALAGAATSVEGVDTVVRRARRLGSAAALAGAGGPLAPLLRHLADAVAAGAPLEPAIRSYIDSERRRRQVVAVERARRLPVRLMIPMTLLVLPGFVLMTYGPAFIDLVTSLLGPLGP